VLRIDKEKPTEKVSTVPSKLELLFAEYVETLSDVTGERRFWSDRKYAQTELRKFIIWKNQKRVRRLKKE
jgi:hypothetical protein